MTDPKQKPMDAGTYLQQFPNHEAFESDEGEEAPPWWENGGAFPEPGEPVITSPELIAVSAIQDIHTLWQIDPDGAEWVGDATPVGIQKFGYGFDWLPGDFRVLVRVHGPHPDSDEPIYRLTVQTDFLSGVDITEPEFFNKLSMLNRLCPSFAIYTLPRDVAEENEVDPKKLDARLESSGYVHAGIIDWFPKFFGAQTILQATEAQFRSEAAAQLLGGHPTSVGAVRPVTDDFIDDMLRVEEAPYASEGAKVSRWSGTDEFEQIIENWGRTEWTFGNADESGLTIEASFGSDSALLTFHTDQPHPRLGNGLLVVVKLPNLLTHEGASSQANNLNFWESRMWTSGRVPFIGNWSAAEMSEDRYCVAYSSFIPNLLYQTGLAQNAVLWGLSRARSVRETR